MIRLDDNREADESLITHAEYQLFLDDMRAQGKFYQPDHWQSYQFPSGQGRQPVLGVRPSDAVAFCEWLTNRMGDGWRYRIPYAAELSLLSDTPGIPSNAGYWTESKQGWSLESRGVLALDDKASGYLSDAWDRALARARARAFARALDRALDRALNLGGDLKRARALDRERALGLALDLARALGCDLEGALNHVSDLVFARDLALDLDRGLGLDRDLARALVRGRGLTFGHDLDRINTRGLYLKLDRDLALDLDRINTRGLYLKLDRDLALDLDRGLGFDLDLDRASARACALDLDRPYALDRDSARARDRALDRALDRDQTYLNMSFDIVVLQGRQEGQVPAFEGIRIVRERAVGEDVLLTLSKSQ